MKRINQNFPAHNWSYIILAVLIFSVYRQLNRRITRLDLFRTKTPAAALQLPFDIKRCRGGIYLDVGSNVGIQVRKLFDSDQFPAAPIIEQVFNLHFPADRQAVCAIGFEPNPRHTAHLKQLETNLLCRGHKVHFFTETAVSTRHAVMKFYKDPQSPYYEWGASLVNWQNNKGDEAYDSVQGIDFAAYLIREILLPLQLHHLLNSTATPATATSTSSTTDTIIPKAPPIVMKMDIEGAEFDVLPHLLSNNVLCAFESVNVEWHDRFFDNTTQAVIEESKVAMFEELEKAKREDLKNCKTEIFTLDDETYADSSWIQLKPCS